MNVGRFAFLVAVTLVFLAGGCRGEDRVAGYPTATGGDPGRGKLLIGSYNCGACHMIPGVKNAKGLVGPPLILFGRRTFIAGEVPNNPSNLVQWIRSPQSIEANTAMPALGLSDQEARDVAAYLYTLR